MPFLCALYNKCRNTWQYTHNFAGAIRIQVWECGQDVLLDVHWQKRLNSKEFQCAFEANSMWTRLMNTSANMISFASPIKPRPLNNWAHKVARTTRLVSWSLSGIYLVHSLNCKLLPTACIIWIHYCSGRFSHLCTIEMASQNPPFQDSGSYMFRESLQVSLQNSGNSPYPTGAPAFIYLGSTQELLQDGCG